VIVLPLARAANVPKDSGDGRSVLDLWSSDAFGGFRLRHLP
jgi:hypothetical protein